MNKLKFSAFLMAAAIALTSAVGCSTKKRTNNESSNTSGAAYSDISGVGEIQHDVNFGDNTDVNDISYKLNCVIDSGKVKDGLKYIYLDVSIKNNTEQSCDLSGINNFYLITEDGKEISTDVRADIYAKHALEGYEQLLKVAAGSEFNGYVGFAVDTNVNAFTVCFFPTGTDPNDKKNVIKCEVKSGDIVTAPDGMFTETE